MEGAEVAAIVAEEAMAAFWNGNLLIPIRIQALPALAASSAPRRTDNVRLRRLLLAALLSS